jgi:hypothetical protein
MVPLLTSWGGGFGKGCASLNASMASSSRNSTPEGVSSTTLASVPSGFSCTCSMV